MDTLGSAPRRNNESSLYGRVSLIKTMEADAEATRSEWFIEFRSDLSAFLDADTVERCIEIGCLERPP